MGSDIVVRDFFDYEYSRFMGSLGQKYITLETGDTLRVPALDSNFWCFDFVKSRVVNAVQSTPAGEVQPIDLPDYSI